MAIVAPVIVAGMQFAAPRLPPSPPLPVLLLLCALVIDAALVGGCGDQGSPASESSGASGEPEERLEGEEFTSEEEREAAEREEAAAAVPAADLTAYYRLTTATGTLRGFAAALATGGPDAPGPSGAELHRTARAVAQLRPEDEQLAKLRPRLLGALSRAQQARTTVEARDLLYRAESLTHALERYTGRVPEAAGAVLRD